MVTEATKATGQGGEAVGMPQLDFSTWPNQIFWLLVTLVVIYLLLTRIALPRIGAVLADRKGAITNDLAAAEELKQKALKAEKAYNEALAQARRDEPGRRCGEPAAEVLQGDRCPRGDRAHRRSPPRTAFSAGRCAMVVTGSPGSGGGGNGPGASSGSASSSGAESGIWSTGPCSGASGATASKRSAPPTTLENTGAATSPP